MIYSNYTIIHIQNGIIFSVIATHAYVLITYNVIREFSSGYICNIGGLECICYVYIITCT